MSIKFVGTLENHLWRSNGLGLTSEVIRNITPANLG